MQESQMKPEAKEIEFPKEEPRKEEAKPALSLSEQLKAAVSPKVWEQVEAILSKVKPDSKQADKDKALQQLGGFYGGALLAEIRKQILKK